MRVEHKLKFITAIAPNHGMGDTEIMNFYQHIISWTISDLDIFNS